MRSGAHLAYGSLDTFLSRAAHIAVRALVDAGVVRSGAHLAYGSLDTFHHDAMWAALDKKVSAISLSSMISAYEHRNAAATAFVVENGGVVAAPVNISG